MASPAHHCLFTCPKQGSGPVIPSSKEPPMASYGFQPGPCLRPVMLPLFPVWPSTSVWALGYSITRWLVSERACVIPPSLSLLTRFPHSTGLNSTPPPLGALSPPPSPTRSNVYFLLTTLIHLLRYDVFIWDYIRNHIVFILLSVGRQRQRRSNKYFCFQSSTSVPTEPMSLKEFLKIHCRSSGGGLGPLRHRASSCHRGAQPA